MDNGLYAYRVNLVFIIVGSFLMNMPLSAVDQTDTPFPAKYRDFPSEIPGHFQPNYDGFDHERRTVMIPMRDGVKLHTVILVPKAAQSSPILLTRTCYDADALTSHTPSSHLGSVLHGYDNATDVIVEGGYIRVIQDIRGKYNSEGDYALTRPLSGPQNPTPVDHSTDTYDTIDWLIKNIPECNGKVGLLGISYNGFLTLMGVINPHPALKVAVPMNPMVDGWIGDDWFHNGAFRQPGMFYIYEQQSTRENKYKWWTSHFDEYDMYMEAGSAGALAQARGLDQMGFWRKIIAHQTYDKFWRDQAVDHILAEHPLRVPMMIVHSLWDAEDIYGAPAVYEAIEPKDIHNDKVYLVIGPWRHGQMIRDGSSLGAIRFNSNTSYYFRQNILRPFLDQYLRDGAPQANIAPVVAYETGTNKWQELTSWPDCSSGCMIRKTPLYLNAERKLSFNAPRRGDSKYNEFISDPSKPVPYRARPIQAMGWTKEHTWPIWLVDDQREASGRPDVLVFTSEVLTESVKISGRPIVNLVASTSGTDSDWVVKLIDVYPPEVAGDPKMGGYQLMIAADIFRGRYRESLEKPQAISPNKPLPYHFALPTANHVFLPGHRIMVQVQSSWFPLYDRNPQTFVDSIFFAKPEDYRKAVQRVWHSPRHQSHIELPMVVSATNHTTSVSIHKLNPEMKKLAVFIGDWNYEGEQDDPSVPEMHAGGAGKFSGTISGRYILGGNFIEEKYEELNPSGKSSFISIMGYDLETKKYTKKYYFDDGSRETSILESHNDEKNWSMQSTMITSAGNRIIFRTLSEFSDDYTSYTITTHTSPDNGKTWEYYYKAVVNKISD